MLRARAAQWLSGFRTNREHEQAWYVLVIPWLARVHFVTRNGAWTASTLVCTWEKRVRGNCEEVDVVERCCIVRAVWH